MKTHDHTTEDTLDLIVRARDMRSEWIRQAFTTCSRSVAQAMREQVSRLQPTGPKAEAGHSRSNTAGPAAGVSVS